MSVSPERFSEFFEAVYGFAPFPWQERLARRVTDIDRLESESPWPQCLALPTGAGKTTCVDIAVFALACQADMPASDRTAPRRIIFVVDRRVIVDEAYEHAVDLAVKLHHARNGKKSSILKDVADALRRIAGSDALGAFNTILNDAPPLTCHQLRGGVYRDDAWARTPTQPCVIASTVDQIGSRLLFRSYGRSNRTWPVHAGLAGNDSLIILDEAHCANPFLQTMQWVDRYRGANWSETPLRNPFQFVVMSATPPEGVVPFRDDESDRRHPVLGRRISTSKPTRLVIAKSAKGRNWTTELAIELVTRAASLVSDDRLAVAVLVNRVATAKAVHAILSAVRDPQQNVFDSLDARTLRRIGEQLPPDFDYVLMTGRMRSIDKDAVMTSWLERLKANANRNPDETPRLDLSKPVFIVATQCLEVGANLDFDGIVTECASLDALRQRFGRLNRVGRWDDAPGIVVIRADQMSDKTEDPVYGAALPDTWKWLFSHGETDADSDEPTIDFGISAMAEKIANMPADQSGRTVLRGLDAPTMLPAYVDCWVQTSPEPSPSPDIGLFLHGPQRNAPELKVCWRADIPLEKADDRETAFRNAVALCPPTANECLPVPLYVFERWLATRRRTAIESDDIADVDVPDSDDIDGVSADKQGMMLVWRGVEDSELILSRQTLRNGDTVVVPIELEGWDEFGCIPSNHPIDVGDYCQLQARHRPTLRLNPALIRHWVSSVSPDDPIHAAAESLITEIVSDDPDWAMAKQWLNALADGSFPHSPQLRTILEFWNALSARRPEPHPFGGAVLRGRLLKRLAENKDRDLITRGETFCNDDDSASESAGRVLLKEHLSGVARHAQTLAEVCGLPAPVIASLELAGRLHDLGKADLRFQSLLWGGNLKMALMQPHLFAKSQGLPVRPADRREASRLSYLPPGFRHELVSLQIVEGHPRLSETEVEFDRDLVLHLIAAHHGQCRPFADVIDCEALNGEAPSGELLELNLTAAGFDVHIAAVHRRGWPQPHCLDSGVPDRFWRLVRRYGWWGLAWLESVFVLSDHRQSELESTLAGDEVADPAMSRQKEPA